MSVEVISWALKQPVRHSSAKFVLVVMANVTNPDPSLPGVMVAYPSVAYLADSTGQDRKTVLANLAKLRELGLISDTGKRVGKTKQVLVYQVHCAPDLFAEQSQKRNSPKNGTVPKTEQSQKRKETVPKTGHGNVLEALNSKSGVCDAGAHEDRVGVFEGHTDPPPPPVGTAVGRAAAALNRAGVKVTSMDPDLIAAIGEGVTAEQLLELADVHDGKPAKYLIATARRLRAEQAAPVQRSSGGARRGGAPPGPRANDDTTGASYQGTPDADLPAELQETDQAANA